MVGGNDENILDSLLEEDIVINDTDGKKRVVKANDLSAVLKEEAQKSQKKQSSVDMANEMIMDSLQRIVQRSGLDFQDDEIMDVRLKNVVLSGLKQLRNEQEMFEVLTKPRAQGGLMLQTDYAQKVIHLVKDEWDRMKMMESKIQQKNTPMHPVSQPTQVNVSKEMIKKRVAQMKNELAKPLPTTAPIKPVVPVQPVKKELPAVKPVEVSAPVVPQTPVIPQITRVKVLDNGRPKMEDVKYASRLVGPIEELRLMNVTDFRRLAQTPGEAVKKLQQKWNLLEEQSYERKVKGILSYYASPLFHEYIVLGLKSLEQSKPLAEIMNAQKDKEVHTLTMEEFNALNKLHRQIL